MWTTGTSVSIGPFDVGETHRFHVDAQDNYGSRTLAILHFEITAPPAAP
jgi:hypothetical protein